MHNMRDVIRSTAAKAAVILMVAAVAVCGGCGKVQDKLQGVNARHVADQFFEAWKKQDWKTVYALSDASFINSLRMQKLTPELQRMSDEELFVHEFKQVQRINPDRILKSYEIRNIPLYKKGDTTVWVYAVVNGRKKKIPMTLDGWLLKIDLTRIE